MILESPKISVVTPTKNRIHWLREAMASVRLQSLETWEHIIVDDGSDDGTAEEVKREAAANPRVRYMSRSGDTKGANACRNQGLRAARADLIVFLDSDDLLEPDCLDGRVAFMERNLDLDFATFQTGIFTKEPGDLGRSYDPELIGDDLLRFLYFETPWIITAPVWRKRSLTKLGMFDETLPSWQDVDLHIRAIAANMRYVRNPKLDHHVRWQAAPDKVSILQRRSPIHLAAAQKMLAKFENVVRQGPGMNWVRQRALCSLYFFIAECWIDVGRPSEALRCWALIRERKLGSPLLHGTGKAILLSQASGRWGKSAGRRVGHKWKGLMRMRTNAELVSP
jgi:glycosyltransferase involved in cell wall biosynthesis